jgi:hypothetical protein
MNTGESTGNDKESEVSRIERIYESSEVLVGSQTSHSTRSQGKPATWGRAGGYQGVKYQLHHPNAQAVPGESPGRMKERKRQKSL